MKIPLYSRFIGGWNISMLQETIQNCNCQGWKVILDYVRESAKNEYQGLKYYESVLSTASSSSSSSISKPGTFFALKMSGIYSQTQLPHFSLLLSKLIKQNHSVTIDAENVATNETTSLYTNSMMEKYNRSHPVVFKTYQMYRKDALIELQRDITYAYKNRFYLGVKLVRGAYHHQDKYSGILFTDKKDTDDSYNEACRIIMWNLAKTDKINPIFATHNQESIELLVRLSRSHFVATNKFAFAQLLGMKDDLSSYLAKNNFTVYKYVPYGSIHESIPYLIRRVYENNDILRHIE